MLYVLVVMPLFSFLYLFIAAQNLFIRHFFRSSSITKGEESDMVVLIENRSFLPAFEIELVFTKADIGVLIPNSLFIKEINGKGIGEHLVNYTCKYRGQYTVGVDYIKMFDILKLFKLKKQVKSYDFIIAYPKTFPIGSFPVKVELTMKEDVKRAAIMDDYYTVADIRKYVPSDSLKKVHWKLSAKRNELLVKRYQASGNNAVAAVLDMTRLPVKDAETRIMYEDQIVSYALSVIKSITDRQMWIDLFYAEDSINTYNCAGNKDFHALQPILAKAEFNAQAPSDTIIRKILKNKDEMGNIILFTANLTDLMLQNLIDAKKLGHNVILVYFSCIRSNDGKLRELEAGGIHCLNISPAAIDASYLEKPRKDAHEKVVSVIA
jgi:uncharacterized protein (DUF58 family)